MTLPPPWMATRPLPPEVIGPFRSSGSADRWVARQAPKFPAETKWEVAVLTGPHSLCKLYYPEAAPAPTPSTLPGG